MPLSSQERAVLAAAGSAPEQHTRGQAVALTLSKTGADLEEARAALAQSFAAQTQPSFHLIPKGDAMASEQDFERAYAVLARETQQFQDVSEETLTAALLADGSALGPLRMIIGFTRNELAATTKQVDPASKVSASSLGNFERKPPPTGQAAQTRRGAVARLLARTVMAVMDRRILTVPPASAPSFHSKLDKRDTRDGWSSVARDAPGVPYVALLYQRYVGGAWRQVQDAYSEVKGDALLEVPLAHLLEDAGVSFHRSGRGATGATQTAQQFGLSPGPDFLLPAKSPTVIIESKVGEDGGTVRDKAARLNRLASLGGQRGLVVCAVVDGKGWTERLGALADVVIATGGRTYTLATLPLLLEVPEVAALKGTAAP